MGYIWKSQMHIKRFPFFCSSVETFRASDLEHLLLKLLTHAHARTHTHPPSSMTVFSIGCILFLGNLGKAEPTIMTYKQNAMYFCILCATWSFRNAPDFKVSLQLA